MIFMTVCYAEQAVSDLHLMSNEAMRQITMAISEIPRKIGQQKGKPFN